MTSLKNQQIELSKLVIHSTNVRLDQDDDAGIAALARNIKTFGLFQNLVVQPLDDGQFGVLGGGRRLKALQALDADARLDMEKIPCRVLSKTMAWQTAISLAENAMQAPMNPVDEFDAFAAMVDQGQTVEQVALAFGITVRQVTERLRYGRVHTDIRAAARSGDITLDALKAFATHPCQEIQKRVFDDLATNGGVREWSVRQRLKEADIMQGDPLARFVGEDYQAKGGDVIPALFEEETVFCDRDLVEAIALEKLQAQAVEIAAAHGFAWAEGRLTVDYGDLSKFDRIYPERGELSEEDAARLAAIQDELERLDARIADVDDGDEHSRLAEACDALEEEAERIERSCDRYDPDCAARAGVIVSFSPHGPEVHAGLIRPEEKPDSAPASGDDESEPPKKVFALSRTLVADLGVERADAVAAALLDQSELATDALFFVVAGTVLAERMSFANIALQCRPAERSHSRPEARDAATIQAIESRHRNLHLAWLDDSLTEGERFAVFRALDPTMKGSIIAWCLGAMISPGLVEGDNPGPHDSFVQTLAALALPNIRDRWLPTEANTWSRVTKAHMLDLLTQLGMGDAARQMETAKRTTLAGYMTRLFAAPPSRLTPEQLADINGWAPDGMQTVTPDEAAADDGALAA